MLNFITTITNTNDMLYNKTIVDYWDIGYVYKNVSTNIFNMSLVNKLSLSQSIVTPSREKIVYYINFIYSFLW